MAQIFTTSQQDICVYLQNLPFLAYWPGRIGSPPLHYDPVSYEKYPDYGNLWAHFSLQMLF